MMAYVACGYFLGPRGVKGELFVRLYGREKKLPSEGEKLFLKDEERFIPCTVERSFSYTKGSVLKLDAAATVDEAALLKGREFFVDGEQAGAFPGREIVGYQVRDSRRGTIGTVAGFEELDPYMLLHCRNGEKSFEVPMVPGLGLSVSVEERAVLFDLPDGYPGVDDED